MATNYPLSIILGAVDRLSGPLAKAERKLGKFGKSATAAGKKLTMGITAPTVALGAVALTAFTGFESGMLRVKALTGATEAEFAKLETQTKGLGRTTVFTAGQVAGAQGFLAQAGFDVNATLAATPGILDLASAAQMDLAETADIASNVLTGYGKSAEDINEVNNVLVGTFTSSNTSLEQLGESMKLAGPVASAMGIEMDETAAILGRLGDAGFQGSLGGTAVRGALAKLAKPANEAVAVLGKLGLDHAQFVDSRGNVTSLIDAVELLGSKGATAGDLLTIFGQRAGPAMTSLVQQGADSIRELRGEINESATAAEIAAIQNSGLAGKMALVKSSAEGLAIAVAESGLVEWFTGMVVWATKLLTKLSESSPVFLKFATIALGVTAALGPLLIVIGQVSLGVSGLMKGAQFLAPVLKTVGVTLFKTVIPAVWSFTTALLANPIFLIVAAVVALIAGLVALVVKWDWVKAKLASIWAGIKEGWDYVFGGIMTQVRVLIWGLEKLGAMVGLGDGPSGTFMEAVLGESIPTGSVAAAASGGTSIERKESKITLEIPDLPPGSRVSADGLDDDMELALGFTLEGA